MPCSVRLTITAGPNQGRVLEFGGHQILIAGRGTDCQLQLPAADDSVSRRQFLIEIAPPSARLRDLESRNGTWVNGRRYGGRSRTGTTGAANTCEVELKHGDRIRAGETEIVFTTVPPSADADSSERTLSLGPAVQEAEPGAIPGYSILALLGRGGSGVVYRARDEANDREVAVKRLFPALAGDRAQRARFLREIKTMRALEHPRIVSLIDAGEHEESLYVVTELCSAGDLDACRARRGSRLPVADACRFVSQALEGLAHAHARGYVHRDIKPGNILLSGAAPNSEAKLADLGMTRSLDSAGLSVLTVTGEAGGTPEFMPPEQLLDFKNVKPPSDVWSMGATLYRLLTDAYPRNRAPHEDRVRAVFNRVVLIEERDPQIPRPLAALVNRALSEDPQSRYPSASQMLDALASLRGETL